MVEIEKILCERSLRLDFKKKATCSLSFLMLLSHSFC